MGHVRSRHWTSEGSLLRLLHGHAGTISMLKTRQQDDDDEDDDRRVDDE